MLERASLLKRIKMSKFEKETLFHFLSAGYDDDDLPDGAWWAKLESGVEDFNKINKTNYDPFDMVHEYLDWV